MDAEHRVLPGFDGRRTSRTVDLICKIVTGVRNTGL
jgi:hypothetical protein